MQISSSVPVMSGSIEDMLAKLSLELEDQAAEQQKASRRAEEVRHQQTLASIDQQRAAADTQLLGGIVAAGAATGSLVGGDLGKLVEVGGELSARLLDVHAKHQSLDAAEVAERAEAVEHARGEKGEAAQRASRLADKAASHLSDVQTLVHQSRMSAIRG